jgi:hypothetical protein
MVELPGFLDSDILGNPMYWMLTAGAELALILGFKFQSSWGAGASMPWYSMVLTLAAVPIASYFIVMKFRS